MSTLSRDRQVTTAQSLCVQQTRCLVEMQIVEHHNLNGTSISGVCSMVWMSLRQRIGLCQQLREAPFKFMQKAFGHCPQGGEEGGSQPLPRWSMASIVALKIDAKSGPECPFQYVGGGGSRLMRTGYCPPSFFRPHLKSVFLSLILKVCTLSLSHFHFHTFTVWRGGELASN